MKERTWVLLLTAAGVLSPRLAVAQSASVAPRYAPLDINNLFNYYGNNGDGSNNPYTTSKEGFEFLKGTGRTLYYEDGIVWGGYQQGKSGPCVGGSAYGHGLLPGPILSWGTPGKGPVAADPSNDAYRIYRVRADIGPRTDSATAIARIASDESSLISRYQSLSPASIYHAYVRDWIEWPAILGAPYTDVDGDGKYDPMVDLPGQPGADQTLWYVANDVDPVTTTSFAGSQPIGLEMQKTIWGYRRPMGALTTTIFQRTRIINKSGIPIDSMFIGQWSDPDIGDAGDDAIGYDIPRSMGYAYNGRPVDAFLGTALPACGFTLLQGPVVPGDAADSALWGTEQRRGYRNLGVGSFLLALPLPYVYQVVSPDSRAWYSLLKGLLPNGYPLIDPRTNAVLKYEFTGDPVLDTGLVAIGIGLASPIDVRMIMSCGPFGMAPGDTQEIVLAQVAALGSDRLSSITALRAAVDKLHEGYADIISATSQPEVPSLPPVPPTYTLYQNYPNPFNPATSIRYELPLRSHVTLSVYSVLGQLVATLVNDAQEAGTHEVSFTPAGLASGVYFYRLQAGAFSSAKKLTILR